MITIRDADCGAWPVKRPTGRGVRRATASAPARALPDRPSSFRLSHATSGEIGGETAKGRLAARWPWRDAHNPGSMTLAMTPDEIVQELSRRHRKAPMPALQAAIEQRADVAPRMIGELDRLLARLNAITEKAETEQEFLALGSELLSRPSPVFYGFLLAAQWKQKEAYPRFAELLSWP